ncbi:hypothetical protein [Erwinia psidii]|uniref:hypothetical protein n=1 Tax=Erwinia psidii TaxID=69224 RepID=UPI00226B79E2|nr:hypothetical protein [Erwinia psidii]
MSSIHTSHAAKNGFGLKHSTPPETPVWMRQTRARAREEREHGRISVQIMVRKGKK